MSNYTHAINFRATTPCAIAVAAAVLLTASCSSSDSGAGATTTTRAGSTSSAASPLTFTNGWVKATDADMSSAFGTLHNPTGAAITVTGVTSSVSGDAQLHTTVMTNGTMQMKQVSSFSVPAKGSVALAPGGNHIMLMKLKSKLRAGETVTLTLRTSAGDLALKLVARPFTGANETYAPSSAS